MSLIHDHRYLPGSPRKKLVQDVRKFLKSWGIIPHYKVWPLAWAWAWSVAKSYQRFDDLLQKRCRERWPLASEIASQYVVVLGAEIRDSGLFHMPFRAQTQLPAPVAEALRMKGKQHDMPLLTRLEQPGGAQG